MRTSFWQVVKKDISRTSDYIQGGKRKKIIGCLRSPGVQAVVVLRFGQWLKEKSILIRIFLEPIYILLFDFIRIAWGIEIPRDTKIGEGFYIGHFGGIIISPFTIIGKHMNISHQVTIGESGQGDKRGCPIIGDHVYIAPGAKIFGKIKVGNHVSIGANAVIYKDVPDNAVVVLDPGFKIISYRDNEVQSQKS